MATKKNAMQGGSQQPYENYHTGPETDSRRTKKLMHQRFGESTTTAEGGGGGRLLTFGYRDAITVLLFKSIKIA